MVNGSTTNKEIHGRCNALPLDENRHKVMPTTRITPDEYYDKVAKSVIPSRAGSTLVRDKALLMCIFVTGARVSEILGLRKRDIVFPANPATGVVVFSFHTEKNMRQRERDVAIAYARFPRHFELIKDYCFELKEPEAVLFPISAAWTWRLTKFYLGAEFTPHWGRHQSASNDSRLGFSVPLLQQKYGWSNFNSPGRYLHLNTRDTIDREQELLARQKADAVPEVVVDAKPVVEVKRVDDDDVEVG